MLDTVSSPRIGVLGNTSRSHPHGAPWLTVCQTDVGSIPPVGSVGFVAPPLRHQPVWSRTDLAGVGISEDPDTAVLISRVEALERYAACVWADHEFAVSAPAEMTEAHIESARWPRCAPEEYSEPDCPFTVPDDDEPITWVRGVDLHSCAPIWVPAGMVFLTLETNRQPVVASTSGCAAYPTMAGAIRRGLCEVIERDASSLIWLARLPVPPLDDRVLDRPTVRLLEAKRARGMESFLFDGTTDLGIPVVLSLDLGPDGQVVLNVSAHPSPTVAAAHCVRETFMPSVTSTWENPEPGDTERSDRLREAAAFLIDDLDARTASAPVSLPGEHERDWVELILERLAATSMRAAAVDLTAPELKRVGLAALKVVVAQLQPYSWHESAQFRAHRRLVDGVTAMGYTPRPVAEQNRLPQPLA
ncbi:MAG TPA: YcaO-like family protein [Solirubrobacteraceae bacterium]|nr:YcaO-like family protein [Solirubrobacteraceae bacterium]